ncbi:MAG: PqiC family protein [Puniceicoccales bacterium]|jgi:uncharacterized lipoprotein YmbA|nr:PqiC family protein [Puniceicoccales bacterium]
MKTHSVFKMKNITAFLALFGTLALSGCTGLFEPRSDPSRYYVIDTIQPEKPIPAAELRPALALSVSRVQIPAYLDRTEIVLRPEANRLAVRDTELWLEPLGKACTRVFSQDLAAQLGTERLAMEPSLDIYRDALQVQVSILQLDGALGNEITLRARWRVATYADGQTLIVKDSEIKVPVSLANYASYVSGLSQALGKLAEEVAGEIRKLP